MKNLTRRQLLLSSLAIVSAITLLPSQRVFASKGIPLKMNDPMAERLGYVEDTQTVNQQKYPKHNSTQRCSGCAQFQGNAPDAPAACRLFAGKIVKPDAWCMSWAKK